MVTRAKLYDEVWTEPMTTVAARYGVAATFLARVCDRMNVPRPPRGYWAKLKFGKAPACPELNEACAGDLLEWSKGQPLPAMAPRPPSQPVGADRLKQNRRGRPALHPFVVGAKDLFLATREPRSHSHDVRYLSPYKRKLVDVVVTKEQLERGLGLMSNLLLLCEGRGCRVMLGWPGVGPTWGRDQLDTREQPKERDYSYHRPWSPSAPTVALVGTVPIGLTVYELSENVEVRYVNGKFVRVPKSAIKKHRGYDPLSWTTHHDVASGRLAVRAYSADHRASWSQHWRERVRGDLSPAKLVEIVRELEMAAPTVAKLIADAERKAELWRQEWEHHQREEERKRVEQARQEAFEASRDELLGIIESWRRANSVEAFFEDAAKRADGLPEDEQTVVSTRLDAARQMLGGTDTLARFRGWQTPTERLSAAEGEPSSSDGG